MRRRTVVLGGAAGAMLAATLLRAQQPGRQYRVGLLPPLSGLGARPYVSALREQLAKHGFVEGRNLSIDVRHQVSFGAVPAMAAASELLALKPDVLLTLGTPLTRAAATATDAVPIVFAWVADPLAFGIIKELARPGGNVTGVTDRNFELTIKRLELVRELLPSAKRVAMVAGYFDAVLERMMKFAYGAAEKLEFQLVRIEAGTSWANVPQSAIDAGAQAALVMTPFAYFGLRYAEEEIVRHSNERRFPLVFANVETVETGGLVSYATRLDDNLRRAANLVARVLRGDRPADLPVDQAARFELAINLKTARAIGLKIPKSLLVRADRVIE